MLFCIIYLFNSCQSLIGVDKAIGYLDDDEEDNAHGDDNADRDLFANISTERALTAENRGIQDFHCAREIKSRNPTKIRPRSANNSLYHENVVEIPLHPLQVTARVTVLPGSTPQVLRFR